MERRARVVMAEGGRGRVEEGSGEWDGAESDGRRGVRRVSEAGSTMALVRALLVVM